MNRMDTPIAITLPAPLVDTICSYLKQRLGIDVTPASLGCVPTGSGEYICSMVSYDPALGMAYVNGGLLITLLIPWLVENIVTNLRTAGTASAFLRLFMTYLAQQQQGQKTQPKTISEILEELKNKLSQTSTIQEEQVLNLVKKLRQISKLKGIIERTSRTPLTATTQATEEKPSNISTILPKTQSSTTATAVASQPSTSSIGTTTLSTSTVSEGKKRSLTSKILSALGKVKELFKRGKARIEPTLPPVTAQTSTTYQSVPQYYYQQTTTSTPQYSYTTYQSYPYYSTGSYYPYQQSTTSYYPSQSPPPITFIPGKLKELFAKTYNAYVRGEPTEELVNKLAEEITRLSGRYPPNSQVTYFLNKAFSWLAYYSPDLYNQIISKLYEKQYGTTSQVASTQQSYGYNVA